MAFDLYLFQTINQFAGRFSWLDTLAVFLARYFEFFLILSLLLLLAFNSKKYWRMLTESFGAAILSRFVITDLIRWFWQRPRPFVENHINLLFDYNASAASFPSGHAAFYFALALTLYLRNKKLGSVFLLAAFLISFARVFAGVHWPSDILAGAVIGIFSGWLVFKLSKKLR
ncbi:MAG: Bacitracin transport permease protein BCRC [Parcubacteria group bacterium Gr01-1014_30]|nr:MAG: Bacitracin transport permease protein BCRC [Parcubacteria group bacterium Gr01-1014_30]